MVVRQGWGGKKDHDLWPLVRAEGVFFITADKGFGDIRAYPPGTHKGVLVLRPARESILEYKSLLSAALAKHRIEEMIGAIVIASPASVRIRRARRVERWLSIRCRNRAPARVVQALRRRNAHNPTKPRRAAPPGAGM